MDVDVITTNFLAQEDVEKGTSDRLKQILLEIKNMENDLARWMNQEHSLNRYIYG